MSQEHEMVQRVLRSLREVNRALFQLLREEADMLDVTPIQMMVLKILAQRPNIGLTELAESLQVGNSTMSGVVDRLVYAGLVVRERSTEDRRSLTMRLTPEGEAKQEAAFGEDSYIMKRLLKILEISKEDLEHLFDIHQRILEKIQEREMEK